LFKSITLVTLPLIAALVLFVPTSCGCRVDLHRGDPLHLILDHPHPHAPVELDGAQAPIDAMQLQDTRSLDARGPLAMAGELLPHSTALAGSLPRLVHGVEPSNLKPPSISLAPADPPPKAP
jgi:hypothetical protein